MPAFQPATRISLCRHKYFGAAGCEIIRAEKVSGSSRNGRSELQLLLEFLRPGDTLMVTRVDRLARSIKDLQDIVFALNQQSVTLKATNSQ